jgi:hypothetical protein
MCVFVWTTQGDNFMENHIERGNRSNFIIGSLLLLFGGLGLVNTFIPGLGLLMWAGVIGGAGVAILGLYARERHAGLLIPVYVLWAIAGLLGLLTMPLFQGMAIPIYVLTAIALPFIVGFIRNPAKNWGLLIPSYVLLAISTMLYLIDLNIIRGIGIGAYVNFAIALPFLTTFAVNRRNWWALIPGGIMSAVGLGLLVGTQLFRIGLPALLIMMGMMVLVGPMLFRRAQPSQEPLLAESSLKYGPEFDKAPEPVEAKRV